VLIIIIFVDVWFILRRWQHFRVVGRLMYNKLEGSSLSLIDVLIGHLPGKKPQEISVRIISVSAEIRIEHLPNTSLRHYQKTNLSDRYDKY
jgi:hypothetical protein